MISLELWNELAIKGKAGRGSGSMLERPWLPPQAGRAAAVPAPRHAARLTWVWMGLKCVNCV